MELFYSTPSCYLKGVHESVHENEWPIKTTDFFPYSVDNRYWTGYFTSRPVFKGLIRQSSALLQVIIIFYINFYF